LDSVDFLHSLSDGDAKHDVEWDGNRHSEWDGDGVFEPHGHQIGDALRVVVSHGVSHGDDDGHGHSLAGRHAVDYAVFFVHALLHGRPDGDAHRNHDGVGHAAGHGHGYDLGVFLSVQHCLGGVQRNSDPHGLGLSNVLSDVDEQFDAFPYRVVDAFAVGHGHGDLDGYTDDHGVSNVDRERDAHAVYVFGDGHENGDLQRFRLFYGFSYGNGNGLRDADAYGDEHAVRHGNVDRYGDDDAHCRGDSVADGKRNPVFVEHSV
jgi:hypothetical protein